MFVISLDFFLLVDTKLRFYCTRFVLIKCVNYFHHWCDNNAIAFGSESPTQQKRIRILNIAQLLSRNIRADTHTHSLFAYLFCSFFLFSGEILLLLQLVSIVFSCCGCGYDRHFSFFSICLSCFDGTLLWRAHSCSLTHARTHTYSLQVAPS